MIRIVAIAVAGLLACIEARAADIRALHSRCFFFDDCKEPAPDAILVSGTVAEGDAEKFRNTVRRTPTVMRSVILRSTGGNVSEAMKIGRDIRKLLMETEGPELDFRSDKTFEYYGGDRPSCVENGSATFKGSRFKGTDCYCSSACFLLYVGGIRRELSYLGIHRVYLDAGTYKDMPLDAATAVYARIKKPLADYLDQMGVPRRYAEIMLLTSSKELHNPTYRDIMTDFYGWIPELEEWILAKCDTVSDRQLLEEKKRAAAASTLPRFVEMRNKRDACIQATLLVERTKRKKDL
jgi:hypothetical protein